MSLTISLIQANLIWENKQANLEKFTQQIEAITEKTEVIVLPEMFTTGFSMNAEHLAETMDGESVQWMKNMAVKKRAVITGSLIIKEGDAYLNRLIWMLPNGQYGYYDKRHLFAMGNEHNHYTAGNKRLIAQVKGWKLNLQICYDLRFPVWARQTPNEQGEMEFDVLVYVANWPDKRNHAWKTLLQARAIENQCYVVGVNRVGVDANNFNHSGDSMFVNAMGEVLYTKANVEFVHTITLDKNELTDIRNKLPFWKDADPFKIVE